MFESIKYYNDHGKVGKAYVDLNPIAKAHWHPVISEKYSHHFLNRVLDAEILLSPEFQRLLEEGKHQDAINWATEAIGLIDKSKPFKKGWKKPG